MSTTRRVESFSAVQEYLSGGDWEKLVDLLVDLRHWATSNGITFADANRAADAAYATEVARVETVTAEVVEHLNACGSGRREALLDALVTLQKWYDSDVDAIDPDKENN